jgi:hypothetical protein
MLSPFPGMDPYLERYWRDVHTRLMVYAADTIQNQLPGDLAARVEESVSVDDDGDETQKFAPDVSLAEEHRAAWHPPAAGTATAVAEPLIVAAEPVERHIEIIDTKSADRIVTVIEFLSPSNKLSGIDRSRYIEKQHEYLKSTSNLVEIDLIRAGDFIVAVSPGNLTPAYLDSYIACVRRADRRAEAEIYRMPLREELPSIWIPLRRTDTDIALNLQALINTCYDRSRYSTKIDYTAEPRPPLPPGDAEWANELLRAAGLRT